MIGISFHVGSGCMDPPVYAKAIHSARKLFDFAKLVGFEFDFLDLGGGFPGDKGTTIKEVLVTQFRTRATKNWNETNSCYQIIWIVVWLLANRTSERKKIQLFPPHTDRSDNQSKPWFPFPIDKCSSDCWARPLLCFVGLYTRLLRALKTRHSSRWKAQKYHVFLERRCLWIIQLPIIRPQNRLSSYIEAIYRR